METDLILKVAGIAFASLFFINWVCTLSGQTICGFRWGDYVIILIIAVVIFVNLGRLRSLAAVVPETAELFLIKPKEKVRDIKAGIQDTRETVNALSGYLQEVAAREMEYQMRVPTPGRAE